MRVGRAEAAGDDGGADIDVGAALGEDIGAGRRRIGRRRRRRSPESLPSVRCRSPRPLVTSTHFLRRADAARGNWRAVEADGGEQLVRPVHALAMSRRPIGSAEAVEVTHSPVSLKARKPCTSAVFAGLRHISGMCAREPGAAIEAGRHVGRLAGDAMDASAPIGFDSSLDFGSGRARRARRCRAAAHFRQHRTGRRFRAGWRSAMAAMRASVDLGAQSSRSAVGSGTHQSAGILLEPAGLRIGQARSARGLRPPRLPSRSQAIALVAVVEESRPMTRSPDHVSEMTKKRRRRLIAASASSREYYSNPASATALSIRLATLSMHFLASPP